ncbi:hypothetical protein Tco_0810955, partial [Tanacetum coccineum]
MTPEARESMVVEREEIGVEECWARGRGRLEVGLKDVWREDLRSKRRDDEGSFVMKVWMEESDVGRRGMRGAGADVDEVRRCGWMGGMSGRGLGFEETGARIFEFGSVKRSGGFWRECLLVYEVDESDFDESGRGDVDDLEIVLEGRGEEMSGGRDERERDQERDEREEDGEERERGSDIPESLHPELPGPEEPIVEFPEGKVGVYTKFFEFANYRIPISQFLFDILGYYQIHLSQLSVIGAAKVSHFEINCRVLNIIPTLNLFRVFYVPSYNSGWMSFSKRPGKNTPQCYTKPLDSLKNWNNRFFWVDERIFPTVVEWRTSAPKDKMPSADSYSAADVTILNTHRTPIQKQPELLLCLVGLSRSYFLGDDVYPTFLYDDDRDMDLFNLISAPNPAKVKTGTRPRAAHEVPLLTVTASRVIEMEDTAVASGSSGTPSALEKSPLDFANEDPPQMITEMGGTADQVQDGLSHEIPPVETATTTEVVQEPGLEKEVAAMGPPVNKRRRKRGNDEAEANAPPKVLRKDHAAFRPAQSTLGGKSLASMGLEAGSTFFTPATQETPTDAKSMSDPEPLSYAEPQPHPEQDVAQSSKKTAPEIRTENVATAGVQDLLSMESLG